jgi:glycosyltransferase involved in cell wall biosynthesis
MLIKNPRNHEELAALVRTLISAPELRKRLGENARRTAERFTVKENARQVMEAYEHVLALKGETQ